MARVTGNPIKKRRAVVAHSIPALYVPPLDPEPVIQLLRPERRCCWPFGDGCTDTPMPGRPYCPEHHARATVPRRADSRLGQIAQAGVWAKPPRKSA